MLNAYHNPASLISVLILFVILDELVLIKLMFACLESRNNTIAADNDVAEIIDNPIQKPKRYPELTVAIAVTGSGISMITK